MTPASHVKIIHELVVLLLIQLIANPPFSRWFTYLPPKCLQQPVLDQTKSRGPELVLGLSRRQQCGAITCCSPAPGCALAEAGLVAENQDLYL